MHFELRLAQGKGFWTVGGVGGDSRVLPALLGAALAAAVTPAAASAATLLVTRVFRAWLSLLRGTRRLHAVCACLSLLRRAGMLRRPLLLLSLRTTVRPAFTALPLALPRR
ncbi:MAG TPA: hypothetical protein VJ789_01435, partial [Burkholderiales bacterium]|nr:hypothetical protein [Burkholderiales bacterium]